MKKYFSSFLQKSVDDAKVISKIADTKYNHTENPTQSHFLTNFLPNRNPK